MYEFIYVWNTQSTTGWSNCTQALGWGVFQVILKPDKTTKFSSCSSYLTATSCWSTLFEGVDFFMLQLHQSYGGGAQRSRPPQMTNQCHSLTQWLDSTCQIGNRPSIQTAARHRWWSATIRTSVRDVADHQRSLPLLGSDRGEGSPSTSALGTPASQNDVKCTPASFIDPPVRVTPSG